MDVEVADEGLVWSIKSPKIVGKAQPVSKVIIFIGPRSDHSLPMSLTDGLTDSLTTLLKLDVTALLKIE